MVKRVPFFYGWVIVGVSTVSGAFTTGLVVWGLGIFITPMQDEFGWSRTTFFLPLGIGGIASSFLGPTLGPYVDRKHGPRLFFLAGVLITGLSVMYLREVRGVVDYLLVFGLIGGVGRYLIQLVAVVIPKWFVRRRGLAQATALGGMLGGGPLIFPLLLQTMINSMGWRDTWLAMGVALIMVGVPAAFLIVRAPEDVGLHPDGDSPESVERRRQGQPAGTASGGEVSITRGEAIRTRQFWLMVVGVSVGMMAIRGIIPNFVPFFIDQGLDASAAAGTVSAYAVTAIVAGFFWGSMGDRFGHRRPYMIACALVASALIAMTFTSNSPMAYGAMVYLGLVLAGFWVLNMLLVANTFGRLHIGAIRGAMQPFNNAAMFGGPVLFGALYDLSESYSWLFALAAVSFLVSAVAANFLRPLQVPARVAGTQA
jgi:OFA family oxalate/formate antiporter-like MFS transporter